MGENKLKGFNVGLLKDNFEIISLEEALEDVIPIEWSKEALSGKKKVIVSK